MSEQLKRLAATIQAQPITEALKQLLAERLRGVLLEDIATARAEGRKEGFERAREMAAGRYERMAHQLRTESSSTSNEKLMLERAELAEQWESEARIIRAIQDEAGGQP